MYCSPRFTDEKAEFESIYWAGSWDWEYATKVPQLISKDIAESCVAYVYPLHGHHTAGEWDLNSSWASLCLPSHLPPQEASFWFCSVFTATLILQVFTYHNLWWQLSGLVHLVLAQVWLLTSERYRPMWDTDDTVEETGGPGLIPF